MSAFFIAAVFKLIHPRSIQMAKAKKKDSKKKGSKKKDSKKKGSKKK